MSATETMETSPDRLDVDEYRYKPVSVAAVVALVFALLSTVCLLFPNLLFLPGIGTLVSMYAFNRMRKRRDELTGFGIAKVAYIANATLFFGVLAFSVYVYATEVPEGYQRIRFSDLQPITGERGPVPSTALQLDGKKVFIKGYTYPGERRVNLNRFVLVPDLETCCFGGQPALTDMIEVTLASPLRTDYSLRCRKLTGVLEVDDRLKPVSGLGGVYYRLKADGIK